MKERINVHIKKPFVKNTQPIYKALLLCWYVLVFSIFGGSYLLQIELPIGGHLFLFRIAALATAACYFIYIIAARQNPFSDLSRFEWAFFAFGGTIILLGLISFPRALSISAWVSKFLMLSFSLLFTFFYLKFARDEKVKRITILICTAAMLICCLGGLAECFLGCFFDTPLADRFYYQFLWTWLQAPVFTFYNSNNFAAFMFFILMIITSYLFNQWETLSSAAQMKWLWLIAGLTSLCLFLFCVGNARLAIMGLTIFIAGFSVWLLLRKRKGLIVLILILATYLFIYYGEYYTIWHAQHEDPQGQQTEEISPPTTPPHGTIGNLVPTDPSTGSISISSDTSGGIRLNLLRNVWEMLKESHFLGVGLGNGEILMQRFDNTGGITAIHCFVAELLLEFGMILLIPALILVAFIFINWEKLITTAIKGRDMTLLSNTVFQIFTALTFPLASTICSSSHGLLAMWLYIGYIILDNREKRQQYLAA